LRWPQTDLAVADFPIAVYPRFWIDTDAISGGRFFTSISRD
jgi:hypothetical protein